ncbi:MAG: polysaccharide deacetylase family protein [Bacteroidota bacterium]|nr:polysaccharide deacetylase family protein [Bacteroidota bacterium]
MMLKRGIATFKKLFNSKAIVLSYHRIAEPDTDPWNLAVSLKNFEQHLEVLQTYNVIPVPQLANLLYNRSIKSKTICITFDDGYKDNYFYAKPLLEKYNFPCSFFIATKYINQKQLFWWDELEFIILHTPDLPSRLSLDVHHTKFYFDIAEGVLLDKEHRDLHKSWKGKDTPPTKRCELYLKLWELLKPLSYSEIQSIIKKLKEWVGSSSIIQNNDALPMDQEQVLEMANNSLFSIGMHTDTHPALAYHSTEVQEEEILNNKINLEGFLNRNIDTIAFPYGSYNDTTIQIVKNNKLKAAFTTKSEAVTGKTNLYQIGRFQVKNWNGKEFEKKLNNWFNR